MRKGMGWSQLHYNSGAVLEVKPHPEDRTTSCLAMFPTKKIKIKRVSIHTFQRDKSKDKPRSRLEPGAKILQLLPRPHRCGWKCLSCRSGKIQRTLRETRAFFLLFIKTNHLCFTFLWLLCVGGHMSPEVKPRASGTRARALPLLSLIIPTLQLLVSFK